MKVAVTGHRPDKLGGYDNVMEHWSIRKHMTTIVGKIIDKHGEGCVTLISGMALGVDQMWAEVGIAMGLNVTAVVPFWGMEAKWPSHQQSYFYYLLQRVNDLVVVEKAGYAAYKMQKRNEWMVNNCDLLVAYWNGTDGGTANCVKYAKKVGRQTAIFNPSEIT